MLNLDGYVLIASDINAGGAAILDLYFDPAQGTVVEDKTTCDGTHLYAEIPVASAIEDMPYEQAILIAEAILCHCSREHNERPLTDDNKRAFDRLVAEVHYPSHELKRIKEAIEDYYSPGSVPEQIEPQNSTDPSGGGIIDKQRRFAVDFYLAGTVEIDAKDEDEARWKASQLGIEELKDRIENTAFGKYYVDEL